MFVTGMNPFIGSVFVFTTLLIAIPSAVKAFNYITTLVARKPPFLPAMLFSHWLGQHVCDRWFDRYHFGGFRRWTCTVHDTYFVVAHFHIVMGMSAIFRNAWPVFTTGSRRCLDA